MYHTQVKDVFGKVADQVTRQTDFVQRRSPVTGSLFVRALVLSVADPEGARVRVGLDCWASRSEL